jgi:hypothetical protein
MKYKNNQATAADWGQTDAVPGLRKHLFWMALESSLKKAGLEKSAKQG